MQDQTKKSFGDLVVAWLVRLQERVTKSFSTEQPVDWRHIDETRERLVRMRFKHSAEPSESHATFMTDVDRPNSTLGNSHLGGSRQTQRQAMGRWFIAGASGLESQLQETIYKRQTSSKYFSDDDWNLKQRIQTDSYSSGSYEPLLIPGINYELDPTAFDATPIAGYIEQTDFPALQEEAQSEVFGYIEQHDDVPPPFGIAQTYQDLSTAFGGDQDKPAGFGESSPA